MSRDGTELRPGPAHPQGSGGDQGGSRGKGEEGCQDDGWEEETLQHAPDQGMMQSKHRQEPWRRGKAGQAVRMGMQEREQGGRSKCEAGHNGKGLRG